MIVRWLKYVRTGFVFCLAVLVGCSMGGPNIDSDESNEEIQISESIGEVPKLSSKRPNLNISVLLDLSDRINPQKYPNEAMEYYKRDLGYVESIAKAFTIHCLNKKVVTMDDRLQVFVEPTPANAEINSLLQKLKIEVNRDNVSKEVLNGIIPKYQYNLNEIYESTIEDGVYPGSDIWGFFNQKLADYCVRSNHRNILFVLTDGYLYYEKNQRTNTDGKSNRLIPQDLSSKKLLGNDWQDVIRLNGYGFIVTDGNRANEIEVFVIGLNGYEKSPYAEEVIRYYWSNWLDNIGVKDFKLNSCDVPSNMDELIRDFICRDN